MNKTLFFFILLIIIVDKKLVANNSIDCTESNLESMQSDFVLTLEEEIAMMDKQLSISLNEFEKCVDEDYKVKKNSESSSSESSNSESGSSESSSSESSSSESSNTSNSNSSSNNLEEKKSVPSESISGAEGSIESTESNNIEKNNGQISQGMSDVTLDNGKIPDDIPEDANDSALEKQIRRAAIKAKDPEKKKRLWNEYRKYKGLNIRD